MGWEMAINCLLQLWETLNYEHGFSFLLTNRLNQDCCENFFSGIRGKGAAYDNPDAMSFRLAFAQVKMPPRLCTFVSLINRKGYFNY